MLRVHCNWGTGITVCLLAGLVLTACQPAPFTFTKIADSNTQIPGREETFTAFGGAYDNGPSISNGVVAFNSQGQDNYQAVFTYRAGKFTMLADTETMVPGKGVRFTNFGHPSIDGGTTSFAASYGEDPPSPLAPADNTAILAHTGEQLRIVADDSTPIPLEAEPFSAFYGGAHGNGNTAFMGYARDGEMGMYVAHRDAEINTLADHSTEVSLLRELNFDTAKPVGVTIPGIEGEFVGDRFVIMAEDVKVHPLSQTRIEMFAANTGPLYIVSEATDPQPLRVATECSDRAECLFDGFPNLALGDSALSLQMVGNRRVLVVEDIGSSLADGVAQLVPETMEMKTELLTPNFSLSTEGAMLVTTQVGTVGDTRDQLFSSLTIMNTGGKLAVTGDWSYVGTTSYAIKVYNGDKLVTYQKGLPTGELVLNGTPDITQMRCHIWVIHWIIIVSSANVSGDDVVFCALTSDEKQNKAVLFYNSRTGMLELVADRNTPIPGGIGTFTDFGVREGFDKGVVAFVGHGAEGQEGVYVYEDGELAVVADIRTPIPDGKGNFTHFSLTNDVSVSNGNIAFTGVGAEEQGGIYLLNKRGELMSIIQHGDRLAGKTLRVVDRSLDYPWWTITPPLNPNAEGFDGNQLSFIVEFPDLSTALYLVTISNEVLGQD